MPFERATLVRVLPFATFMLLLAARAYWPADADGAFDPRWLYALTVLVVGGQLFAFRREYGELARQNLPSGSEWGLAIGVGLAVFGLWITLDAPWMVLDMPVASFVPLDATGAPDWPLIVMRWTGATLLVPVMEELFWRSFLMRWLQSPRFAGVLPQQVGPKAVLLSTFVFTLAHTLWLAAAIAGLAYAWLYIRTGRLWVAVLAHAVTNGALGVWVVATGHWHFW